MSIKLIVSLVFGVVCGPLHAQVVFEQLPDPVAPSPADASGELAPDQRLAERFEFASPVTIVTIEFWGNLFGPDLPDNFTINIYEDDGGLPGLLLSSQTTASVTTSPYPGGGVGALEYSADLTVPFHAEANVGYFVSITNNTNAAAFGGGWVWYRSLEGPQDGVVSPNAGITWFAANTNWSLRLLTDPDGRTVLYEQLPEGIDIPISDSGSQTKFSVVRFADEFTLPAGTAIGAVEFWGAYSEDQVLPDDFTIVFYGLDPDGTPDFELASFNVGAVPFIDVGPTNGSGGLTMYRYTATLPEPYVPFWFGNIYHISITNNTGGDVGWGWQTHANADPGDINAVSVDSGVSWTAPSGREMAFRILAPEPPCVADVNGDDLLTPADFNAWVIAFNSQTSECDQNGDALCTPADFNAWVVNFNAGCP